MLVGRSRREILHSGRTAQALHIRWPRVSKMFLRLSAIGVFVLYLVALVNCDLDLQLLHVVFRHGEKVPHKEYQNYPTDPYKDYNYRPMGSGDLTNQGKQREYRIGTMLRERYDRYFGPDYWPEKIYARSTHIPRTQLSLQLVLAGLFPPSERQTWNSHLPWIPAFTFFDPYETDNLLFPHHCPRIDGDIAKFSQVVVFLGTNPSAEENHLKQTGKEMWYREEYSKFLKQEKARDMVNKYKNVFSYLTEHSGKTVNTTSAVTYLYNLLKEEAAQNLTLPKWTETVYPTPMKEIIALDFRLRSYTRTLKRLSGGMLIRKIVEDVKAYKVGRLEPYDRKAFLFSAHEMNVAALARALELDEPIVPAYGATLILETLRDKKGNYYVRVLYWTGVSEQLNIKTIPGCAELCPLEDFVGIVQDLIPSDDEFYCHPSGLISKTVSGRQQQRSSSASGLIANAALAILLSSYLTSNYS